MTVLTAVEPPAAFDGDRQGEPALRVAHQLRDGGYVAAYGRHAVANVLGDVVVCLPEG